MRKRNFCYSDSFTRSIIAETGVRLVQEGKFRNNLLPDNTRSLSTFGMLEESLDRIIAFKYMGVSEMDGGALQASLRRMGINYDQYKLFTFDQFINSKGQPLHIYSPIITLDNTMNNLDHLLYDQSNLLRDCSMADETFDKSEDVATAVCSNNNDFWWDIENDVFYFYGEYEPLLRMMAENANIFEIDDVLKSHFIQNYCSLILKNSVAIRKNSLQFEGDSIEFEVLFGGYVGDALQDAMSLSSLWPEKNVSFEFNGSYYSLPANFWELGDICDKSFAEIFPTNLEEIDKYKVLNPVRKRTIEEV